MLQSTAEVPDASRAQLRRKGTGKNGLGKRYTHGSDCSLAHDATLNLCGCEWLQMYICWVTNNGHYFPTQKVTKLTSASSFLSVFF